MGNHKTARTRRAEPARKPVNAADVAHIRNLELSVTSPRRRSSGM